MVSILVLILISTITFFLTVLSVSLALFPLLQPKFAFLMHQEHIESAPVSGLPFNSYLDNAPVSVKYQVVILFLVWWVIGSLQQFRPWQQQVICNNRCNCVLIKIDSQNRLEAKGVVVCIISRDLPTPGLDCSLFHSCKSCFFTSFKSFLEFHLRKSNQSTIFTIANDSIPHQH